GRRTGTGVTGPSPACTGSGKACPPARVSSAPTLAVLLLASACSSDADPEELRELLVENGLTEEHIEITGPDADGLLWVTYDIHEDCELQLKWDGEGEILVLGTHAEGYFQEAPDETALEGYSPTGLTRTCDGRF